MRTFWMVCRLPELVLRRDLFGGQVVNALYIARVLFWFGPERFPLELALSLPLASLRPVFVLV